MTSRERVQLVLNNKKPDRLPFNFWMDRDKLEELDRRFGENFRVSHYGADVIEAFPSQPFFAEFAKNAVGVNDGTTTWMTKYPVESVAELANAAFFNPDDPALYQQVKNTRAKYPDKAVFALMVTPLDILFGTVGMEQLFCEFVDYADLIEELAEKISQQQCRIVEHAIHCDIDVLYLGGDICSTKGSMMSNNQLRRFSLGPVKKLVDLAHEAGLKVFYHTDGYVMDILPLFVEYGFDGINPLQSSVNNDPEVFMKEYGDKLMVYGGMDNCFIIPDGTTADVKNHVEYLFQTLGKNGRYIASSHDIPSKVPLENIDIMVETIKNCKY